MLAAFNAAAPDDALTRRSAQLAIACQRPDKQGTPRGWVMSLRTGSAVAAVTVALLLATGTAAASGGPVLVLRSAGTVVKSPSKILGYAGLGPCGSAEFFGRLENNGKSVDQVRAKGSSISGGCGEGGPDVGGRIKTITLAATGTFTVSGKIVYTSGDLEEHRCTWQITRLEGQLTLPGPAVIDELMGVGKLRRRGSEPACAATQIFYGEAALYDATSFQPLEAGVEA